MRPELLPLIYFALISLITAGVTCADKHRAKKGSFRISEGSLFVLALLGGALSEYITMRLIRHKTLHKRFMLGLPAIILLHLTALILLIIYH